MILVLFMEAKQLIILKHIMKNIFTKTLTALLLLFFNSSFGQTATDIDGNVYNTVTIGTQEWLKENLKTTKLTDGTPINLITDNTTWQSATSAAYCWYGNDQALNGTVYGALYNWYTVSTDKLCPNGWHVPSNSEWQTLVDYLGGASIAGNKLKESGTAHWYLPNSGATNESGFTALPGGQRGFGGFDLIKGSATFWTSTEVSSTNAETRALFYHSGLCQNIGDGKDAGKSVRCIKGGVNSLDDAEQSSMNYFIYPNPAKGVFYIRQHETKACSLEVFDLMGKLILAKLFSQQTSVSLSIPGIYTIHLRDINGYYSKMVLIQ
jgi:uncharacterized protein (TIGR02145 family)